MEKEIIKEIKEHSESKGNWGGRSGYIIVTDKQEIKLLIDDGQQCCESWGYFITEDNISEFIGAELAGVSLTDTLLNNKKLGDIDDEHTSTMFVNVNTSKGLLQFAAYNSHNGYYGHEASVISNQLNHSETL